jgi:sRNA-binding protein
MVMAMDGVAGVSRALDTAAVARVAANPYQNNAVRPDVSGQEAGPRQIANEQYLNRKISERQAQKAELERENRDRLEISREAKNAWQTGSMQRRQEQSQDAAAMNRVQEKSDDQRQIVQAASMREDTKMKNQTGSNLNIVM